MSDDFDTRGESLKERMQDRWGESGAIRNGIVIVVLLYILITLALGFFWSSEPDAFAIRENTAVKAETMGVDPVTGFTIVSTLITVADTMLHKPGGYLSNDMTPPGIWLDNIPNWEYGVLTQVRDFTEALRRDFSRSQSQSTEDEDLITAENSFKIDHSRWALPSSESEYQTGIDKLNRYIIRLSDRNVPDAQFYSRADNLQRWLQNVETRLGSLSQRLSASVGKPRLNTDLSGDPDARQSTPNEADREVKTPWTEIDDVFFEARGSAWALAHLLRAIEVDFRDVLEKKNALVSLRQIIRELDSTQETVWSPVILNGSGFGLFANHSLVMASYISRANAAIADLRMLLSQG